MYPWCNGNIAVSKTVVGGSNPSGYATLILDKYEKKIFY